MTTFITKHPILLISSVLWIGFILAISFMEAWLKFRAPGITLPLGLGIGRLVFFVLNKIEWILAIILILHLIMYLSHFNSPLLVVSSLLLVLLILQTFWLLPLLDARAEDHIQGKDVASSFLHLYYVIAELLKLLALAFITIKLFIRT